ncbi:hypothetical protein SRM_p61014 (plasmid) [Salinibacter ruber M8]|uniref:Uncharacterized protein n=1 Tax=Salinibacter ruber (strain M8) TaxID=761659 RepID=D5H4D0_SALRM|nr:hypothetical protein [Salinibacter ruber]CBH22770.1 hypothetical protein SRM_p61014 [Salinibacter ruber M8]
MDDLKDKLLSAARAAGRLDGTTVEIEAEVDTDRARQALSSLRGRNADAIRNADAMEGGVSLGIFPGAALSEAIKLAVLYGLARSSGTK